MKLNDRFDKLSEAEAKALIKEDIEDFLKARHESQNFRTAKAKLADEVAFLAGAMSALHVCFGDPKDDHLTNMAPVIWVVNTMTGRSVLKEEANASK